MPERTAALPLHVNHVRVDTSSMRRVHGQMCWRDDSVGVTHLGCVRDLHHGDNESHGHSFPNTRHLSPTQYGVLAGTGGGI